MKVAAAPRPGNDSSPAGETGRCVSSGTIAGRYLQRMISPMEVEMKTRFFITSFFAAITAPALAADYADTAEVVNTVPVYGSINEPRQQCWTETVTTYQQAPRSYGGTLLGGIAGGLIGSTIGRGDGRVAAAAAGAAIGALAGNRADERNAYSTAVPQQVQRCRTVDTLRQGITGYQVTYNYNGRNATVIRPYDPGPRVNIDISVAGAGNGYEVAPQSAYTVPQPDYARALPQQQITYIDANGQVPIWAYKPYKRPRPVPESN